MKKLNWALLILITATGVSVGSVIGLLQEGGGSPYLAPHPDDIFKAFTASPRLWGEAVLWTLSTSVAAAVISVLLGMIVGFVAAFLKLWSLDKWCQLVWSIPLIGIATYLLLAVGYGWLYGLSLGVFLGFYPVQKHTFDFCSARHEGICSIAASFGLTRWQEYSRLRFPAAFRSLGTSLSQSVPLCFIGETMGEFTSAQISQFSIGLGGFLRYAQSSSNYAQLWLSILLMMFLVFFSGELVKIGWQTFFPCSEEKDMFQ